MIKKYKSVIIGDGITPDTSYRPILMEYKALGVLTYTSMSVVEEQKDSVIYEIDTDENNHEIIRTLDGIKEV